MRSQEDDLLKRKSRPTTAQHRTSAIPGEEEEPSSVPQPYLSGDHSGVLEHEGLTFNQTSRRGRPPYDALPQQPQKGEPVALDFKNDTCEKEGQAGQLVPRASRGAESPLQDEPIRVCGGGESDELVDIDVRAHTLLEHCRQLLAPPSTSVDQVLKYS